jgi:hypothetical protein
VKQRFVPIINIKRSKRLVNAVDGRLAWYLQCSIGGGGIKPEAVLRAGGGAAKSDTGYLLGFFKKRF